MPADERDELLTEIAATAARLIAEDGCDYRAAKRRAAAEVLGDGPAARRSLPDNALVEAELRRYLLTFGGAAHAARLRALRELALALMVRFERFNPHLIGAVLNGTATDHSDIHLHLFCDSPKDVELQLLGDAVDFEVGDGADEPGGADETLHFVVPAPARSGLSPRVGVVLSVHGTDAIRVAPRTRPARDLHPVEASGRANLSAVQQLLAASAAEKE